METSVLVMVSVSGQLVTAVVSVWLVRGRALKSTLGFVM